MPEMQVQVKNLDAKDIEGFEKFIENYKGAIAVEKTASEVIK